MLSQYHWTVELWWHIERFAGWLWRRGCPPDQASYWLDWFPAWAYRHRKQAEHRHPYRGF